MALWPYTAVSSWPAGWSPEPNKQQKAGASAVAEAPTTLSLDTTSDVELAANHVELNALGRRRGALQVSNLCHTLAVAVSRTTYLA
jgi:hypothetical protein